mmetsp:Transcript_53994/g.142304  ORF Transcript_53994/g.142304 Transcript_53994/m.142304 type:complete len:197 (+) Transcript_53994:109-699(+)
MRCCWTGGRPWAGLPWVQQPQSLDSSGGWGGADCGAGGCGTTEVISVQLGGGLDCCSDLEAPLCLAPPGLSVLPPPPRASWAAGNHHFMAEPLLRDSSVAPSAPVAQPQMQLRMGKQPTPYCTGAWNENGPREVRRRLDFNCGDWDSTVDYVPSGSSLWEDRLEADWASDASEASEDDEDRWGANENAPYFLGEEP